MRRELPVEPAMPLAHVFEMLPYGLRVPGGRSLPQTFYGAAGRIVQAVAHSFGEGIEGLLDALDVLVGGPIPLRHAFPPGAEAAIGWRLRAIAAAIFPAWWRLFSMKILPISVPPRIAPAR